MTTTAQITTNPDGSTYLSIDQGPAAPLPGSGRASQEKALEQLRHRAATTGQPVDLHVGEHTGQKFHLTITPDGRMTTVEPPSSASASTDAPVITTVPLAGSASEPGPADDTDESDVADTVMRPVPPAAPQTAASSSAPTAPTSVVAAAAPLVQPSPPPVQSSARPAAAQPSAPPAVASSASPASASPVPPVQPPSPRSPSPAPVEQAPSPEPAPVRPNPVEQGTTTDAPATSDPRWAEMAAEPATQGLRGTLNSLGLKLSPASAELEQRREQLQQQINQEQQQREAEEQARQEQARREQAQAEEEAARRSRQEARARENEEREREQRRLIQTNFQGVRTILVANPKGGARKTTTTYLLAATMGIIRGGSVIAWDANETMGTLGERAHQDQHSRTVVDLLEKAAPSFATIDGSRLGALDAYVRPQGDSHFDVLASDEDATRQDIVDGDGFDTVHEILSRFYRMILVDTGNNIRVPHFLAAVEKAEQLVIPVAAGVDSARAAQKMMRSLTASGHGDLVEAAVVLIHDLEPSKDAGSDYLQTVRDIAAEFEDQVAAVVGIPFDPALKGGDRIDYDALTPATQRAYREAAAAVATSLRSRILGERS